MKLIHKALDFQVRQVGSPADRVLEFIGSTADVDRYGDIIEVEGWDLKHYLKNPQFLWAHNYSVPPVGTTRKVTKADGALAFQVYFPTDEEVNVAGWPSHVPTPETVYKLYLGGFLRATSVGFQGLEWEPILGEPDEQGYKPRIGTRYTKQDLYELSAVPVPANPYALMNAVQKGIIPEEQARLFEAKEGFRETSITFTPKALKEAVKGAMEDLFGDKKKEITDYYSLVLSPDYQPHGGRIAVASEADEPKEAEMEEIFTLTQNLRQAVNGSREGDSRQVP